MRSLAALFTVSVFSVCGIACGGDNNEPECRLNSDCPGDELCITGKCLMECKTNKDCLPDGECKGGYCDFGDDGSGAPDLGNEGDTETCQDYCDYLAQCMEEDKGPSNDPVGDMNKCLGNCEQHDLAGTGYYPQCE